MNSKFLFLLSIVVIAIGGFGLLRDNPATPIPSAQFPASKTTKTKLVNVAVAQRNIPDRHILTGEEYGIKSERVPEDADDGQILKSSDLNGYLTRTSIAAGSVLTKDMLISPESPEFIRKSMRDGEISYYFPIDKKSEYLFSIASVGQTVAILLKYKKPTRKTMSVASIASETGILGGGQKSNISDVVIKPIFSHIQVVAIVRPHGKNDAQNRDDNSSTGALVLKLTPEQFTSLMLYKEAGELIVHPEGSSGLFKENSIDAAFPELNLQIREIRGHRK